MPIQHARSREKMPYFAIDLQSAHKMWGRKSLTKKRDYLMEHINRIELKGRVGTVRSNTHNESKVANFTLVTEFLYKTRGGEILSDTTWFNVVAWEGKDIADIDKIEKGTAVHVVGRMRTSKYNNADGVEKIYYEVLASKLKIVEESGDSVL